MYIVYIPKCRFQSQNSIEIGVNYSTSVLCCAGLLFWNINNLTLDMYYIRLPIKIHHNNFISRYTIFSLFPNSLLICLSFFYIYKLLLNPVYVLSNFSLGRTNIVNLFLENVHFFIYLFNNNVPILEIRRLGSAAGWAWVTVFWVIPTEFLIRLIKMFCYTFLYSSYGHWTSYRTKIKFLNQLELNQKERIPTLCSRNENTSIKSRPA